MYVSFRGDEPARPAERECSAGTFCNQPPEDEEVEDFAHRCAQEARGASDDGVPPCEPSRGIA
jgi:hypothetical protein